MTTTTAPAIDSVVLEVDDVAAATDFYASLGVADRVHVRPAATPTAGFRGFGLSLVVSGPGAVDAFARAALDGGATALKPAARSFWGYGAVVQAPDGALWKIATSAKKDSGPAAMAYDDLVLLLGAGDVKAARRFYEGHGLEVGKSFGSKYVEFASAGDGIKLALYPRRAAAKDLGVDPAGTGSRRIVLRGRAGDVTDPDGFRWEVAD
ncbi:glyoxalase [Actinotalea sp. M2MS4P-6]|uniref:glyoxalase n=1 Tax=Actinotalea sp. M2MS4P-6 TaxID=2983762 RepID=UPI0021E3C53B|nr:glyoxalase [Actinotalea sp. M2MS4P-6]MCV2392953.1 glyoxalase [Actinotalea sp. M2MS4P-6]